jgi:predicted RNA-binding protein associated with RNAse of E/G family
VKPWSPGDHIEMREIWRGKTWEVRQGFVVEDSDELVAIYTPPAMPAVVATMGDGKRLRLPPESWELEQSAVPSNRRFLAIHPWGNEHSTLCIWDDDWRMLCWYINLETDARRTDAGIAYEEHILDVVVKPDMSSWRWKDEDELEEAIALGHFTLKQAAEFRAEGERALEWLLARRSPYNRAWNGWRPPAHWDLASVVK